MNLRELLGEDWRLSYKGHFKCWDHPSGWSIYLLTPQHYRVYAPGPLFNGDGAAVVFSTLLEAKAYVRSALAK